MLHVAVVPSNCSTALRLVGAIHMSEPDTRYVRPERSCFLPFIGSLKRKRMGDIINSRMRARLVGWNDNPDASSYHQ